MLFIIKMLNFQHQCFSLQCHTILQTSFRYNDLVMKKHLFFSVMKTLFLVFVCFFCGNRDTLFSVAFYEYKVGYTFCNHVKVLLSLVINLIHPWYLKLF